MSGFYVETTSVGQNDDGEVDECRRKKSSEPSNSRSCGHTRARVVIDPFLCRVHCPVPDDVGFAGTVLQGGESVPTGLACHLRWCVRH